MVLGAVGAVGVAAYKGGLFDKKKVQEGMEAAITYVQAQGDNALYFYLGFTLVGVVLLIPTTPMEFAGGFLFSPVYGMWTTWLLTCAAKMISNFISVLIARFVVRDWVQRNVIQKWEILRLVSTAVEDEPYKMAFLVRGSMVPLFVKNYALGVMEIGYLPVMLASCVFTPFYALQNIMLGSACQDLKEVFSPTKKTAGDGNWTDTAKAVMPIVFNVALIFFLIKAIKQQMKKQKDQIEKDLRAKTEKKAK